MFWVQQQPVPPSQPPQPPKSSTLLSSSSVRPHVSSSTTISSTLNTSTKPQPQNLAQSTNNQPTNHPWQLQQHSSMMQPTPNPPTNYNAAPNNNWSQQQQQHNNAGNSNVYQPLAPNNWMQSELSAPILSQQQALHQQQQQQQQPHQKHQPHQQHQPHQLHQSQQQSQHFQQHPQLQQQIPQQRHHQLLEDTQQTTSYFASYFNQGPQSENNLKHHQQNEIISSFSNYQQNQQAVLQPNAHQQPSTQAVTHNPTSTIQPPSHQNMRSTHVTQQQQDEQVQNVLNNNDNKNDGWSDWDWNDNNINNAIDVAEQLTQLEQQHTMTTQIDFEQHNQYNANFIQDSFGNDSWHWGLNESRPNAAEQNQESLLNVAATVAAEGPTTLLNPSQDAQADMQFQQPQVPTSVAQSSTSNQHFVEFSVATAKPASLPLPALAASAEFSLAAKTLSSRPEATSDTSSNSFATATPAASTTTTTSNIPNSVYVSQAKPVAKPSRQYASPPVASPTELPELSALSPPHAFQNENFSDTVAGQITNLASHIAPPSTIVATAVTALQPPPAMTPPASFQPSIGNTNSAVGNPFKRAGAAQHRGAFIAPNNSSQPLAPLSTMNFVVPPPPAGFATPMQPIVSENIEPDNSEILHENQEVIVPAVAEVSAITLPQSPAPTQVTAIQTPPNDERNQYLQTSHLSENMDEDLNIETDNFPPPGLSRLVLGQPEYEASQRMVTGTDQEIDNLNINERHADGEDTSLDAQMPVLAISTAANVSISSNNIDITTDRNLYLVAGESIARNEPRVVTGVERVTDTAPASQIINEQRDIELDGENLEDQQLQQTPQVNTVASRNEPPLEGAVASSITAATTTVVMPPHSIDSSHKQGSGKDHSNISTGNDESDPLHEQQRYSTKSARTRHEASTLEKKFSEKQRKEKQRSVDRYASDDSDAYPSEHERDRRRNYREGSTRSDRGLERDLKEKKNRRDMRGDFSGADRERDREKHHHHYRAEGGERSEAFGGKSERRSQRYHRYEADSKYETEESTRHEAVSRKERRSGRNERERERERVEERSGRSDRSDRDYEEYRRYHHGNKREGKRSDDRDERRDRRDVYAEDERRRRALGGGRRGDKDYRTEYENTLERRTNRRSDKHRGGTGADQIEYEEYRKQSSRNARESDLDKDRRNATRGFDPRHAGMYAGYPSTGYGYDPYTYYYEQMARTNPQAYAEWYKKYYGHAAALQGSDHLQAGSAAATDGRESVHSGRSSANNDNDRSGNLSMREAAEPQRMTPCKFVNDHAVVSFSAGLLITVKPKYTPHGVSNVVKLLRLSANDGTRQLFQAFPGPLVRGLTHKKTVIEFCEEQIQLGPSNTTIYAKQLLSSNVEKFKASYTLMWNLLILLLRQNGMVVGTDIAELLLKNQVQYPYNPQSSTPNSTASNSIKTRSKSESDSIEDADMKDSDIECEAAVSSAIKSNIAAIEESAQNGDDSVASVSKSNTATSSCSSEEEITAKFRNFLLYGNVNEALDWATDNNLWGHALFLASKVDRRSHANVMMKFANKLSLNDPLQTLYQLMSGRTPSSVTSVQDEKWGDWRPHLSMILSNTSQKPELDRKAITTLGDSLFNRGDLYAAHFCYLMAQVGFGRYQDSATCETALQQTLPKLVLLGSSHYKQFKDFATNEAIIMTEIYEYACSLNDEKFSLVEFQPYKYLLATRMLDYGFQLKSLMYLEQISLHIERDPSKYEPSFINKVYEFADRLKFYDPVLEKPIDDPQNQEGSFNSAVPNMEEQKWLQNLRGIAAQYKPDFGYIASANTGHANAVDENLQLDYQKQFAEINKQFSELNMQYNSNNNSVAEGIAYNTENLQQQIHPNNDNVDVYSQQQQQQQQQQQEHNMQQQSVMTNSTDYAGLYGQSTQHAYGNLTEMQTQDIAADNYAAVYGQQHQHQYYDPNQQLQQQQQQTEFNASNDMQQNSGAYDYWGGQQQSQQPGHEETSRPTISMPNSKKSYESDGGDEQKSKQEEENTAKKNKNDGKDGKSSQLASNQNSGWFGGIWNKLSLKPKNQMILPDDKNPSIVWDAEKKRWVNTDGGDDGGADALKPPPKMGELLSQQQQAPAQPLQTQQISLPHEQQMQAAPISTQFDQSNQYGANSGSNAQMQQLSQPLATGNAGIVNPIQTYSAISASAAPTSQATNTAEPTKPPSLQSNMFKMQRNRTLKNSYVDVFNPSGAPMSKAAENVMAPALPPAAVPQGGFFIPGAPPNTSDDASGAYQQEPAQDLPQFYNPNQFGAATGSSY